MRHHCPRARVPSSFGQDWPAPLTLTHTTVLEAIAATPNAGGNPVAAALFIAGSSGTAIAGFGGNGSGWTLNGGAVASNNGQATVTVPIGPANTFYRLQAP